MLHGEGMTIERSKKALGRNLGLLENCLVDLMFGRQWDPLRHRIVGPRWYVQVIIQSRNWVEVAGTQCLTNPLVFRLKDAESRAGQISSN
jgi:hypothetical protein